MLLLLPPLHFLSLHVWWERGGSGAMASLVPCYSLLLWSHLWQPHLWQAKAACLPATSWAVQTTRIPAGAYPANVSLLRSLLLLLLPLQLDALVSSVAANSSIRSLSLHGLALNLYASHQLLLDTLLGLKPLSRVPQQAAAAARSSGSAGQQPQSMLQHVDLSFTKHCAVAPTGMSLSKIWARIKKQQHDAALQQQLGALNQMKAQLLQFCDAAIAAAAAGAPPLPPEIAATAVAAALALVIDGDAAAAAALQQQLDAALQVPQPGQQQQQPQAVQQAGPNGAAGAGGAAGFAIAAAGMMAGPEGPGNDGLTLLNQTLMQLDQQVHMLTHHSPHAVSEMTMGHASAASAADKQLIELLQDALRARGVGELSVRMHGSSAADKPGQHGKGSSAGQASWGGGSGSKRRVSDEGESDDDSSDGEGPSMGGSNSSSNQLLSAKPRMGLGFFESSGISGALDNIGSFAASCLAFTTVFVAHGARNAAGQHRTSWLGKAVSFVQLGVSVGLTFAVAMMAAITTRFASAEELEHLRAVGFLPPDANNEAEDEEEDDEDSSEWEELEQDEVMEEDAELAEVEPVPDHHPAPGIGQEEGGGGGGVAGAMQAAVAAAANVVGGPAAAMLAGGGAGGLLPAAAPHLNEQFVDQGIQDLLNPEGEDKALEAADANGGMTGIPSQVQVVAGSGAASWAFMAGFAPVSALGVWFWARQLKWVLGSVVVPVLRYLLG
jgi:hypothetical protein